MDSSDLKTVAFLLNVMRWLLLLLGIWVLVVSVFEIRYLGSRFQSEHAGYLPSWVRVDSRLGKRMAVEYMYMTDSPTGEIIILDR